MKLDWASRIFHRDPRGLVDGFSLSGDERNHLFLSAQAKQFFDISGVSGCDHPGDSRSFAILDYDRDGWLDIALVNSNAPLFQLYRNQIGSQAEANRLGRMLAVQLVGGNHTAEPSQSWSNRGGIGAMVTVALGDFTIRREHRAGEGLGAQNSAVMVIGIGAHTGAQSLAIRWPSGQVQETHHVPEGTLVTVYENPAHSPTGQNFTFQPYRVPQRTLDQSGHIAAAAGSPLHARQSMPLAAHDAARKRLELKTVTGPQSRLRLYTTLATWCATCTQELPQWQRLHALFGEDLLQMFGIPVDDTEGPERLKAYVARHQPTYTLLMDLAGVEVESVRQFVRETLRLDGLPATIITDDNGYVLRTMWGAPSISDIQMLLSQVVQ
jgi:peroxiredoxin